MKMRVALVFAIAGLAAATVQAQDVMIKPQQTIQFKANAYGCLSKDKLDAADQHAQAGEQQEAAEKIEHGVKDREQFDSRQHEDGTHYERAGHAVEKHGVLRLGLHAKRLENQQEDEDVVDA